MLRYLVIIIIFFISVDASAQKRKTQRAYDAMEAGEYYDAIDLFKDAYTKTKERTAKAELNFMVAECYRLTNDPRNAETWYKRIADKEYARPEATLGYAEMLRKNGKYEEALEGARKAGIYRLDARARFLF